MAISRFTLVVKEIITNKRIPEYEGGSCKEKQQQAVKAGVKGSLGNCHKWKKSLVPFSWWGDQGSRTGNMLPKQDQNPKTNCAQMCFIPANKLT